MDCTSLYIHIPFCKQRCGYCDFNSYAGQEYLIPVYFKAVSRELECIAVSARNSILIHTIYFGGGTPSLLHPTLIADILGVIKDNFTCMPSIEITLEANPGTVSREHLDQLRQTGVSRLSLGMQSANAEELQLLERKHTFSDVLIAVGWARQAGFTNLNLDLIFGLPKQQLSAWLASLEAAVALQPDHLSLYALTLEHGTPLYLKVTTGSLPEPDPDLAADMYEIARDRLQSAGYNHYEISNWARDTIMGDSYSCRHNLQYWRGLPYLGVGAGAHGFINHYRTVNVATPKAYIHRMENDPSASHAGDSIPRTPATIETNFIDREAEMGEFMMMGLRLVEEGVSRRTFRQRFGVSLKDRYAAQIDRLISLGLLEWAGEQYQLLRLTRKGHLLGNLVFKEFI
jgi:oxygen-independent coproporphyrinogen-3 oxidase